MLSQKGHEVTIFVNDTSVDDFTISNSDGGRVVRFNPSSTGASSFLGHVASLSYEFAHITKRFIDEEGKPDIIEAQEYLGIAYYLLQFKYLMYDWSKDLRVLITMHSPAFLYLEYNHVPLFQYPNYWIGEMERFCIQAADAVISPSKFLIDEVGKRFKYSHSNFFVVPNPFDFKVKHEADVCLNKDIVFFGKLSAQKGTFSLLRYFKSMWEKGFCEPLVLIGGQDIVYHPEGKTMGDVIRRLYKSYIQKGLLRMESQIAPSQIHSRLQRAKVVIVPSTVDNLPYVVMEMMSLGLVVLVSMQGGQAEIVENGLNGFVFDHEEEDSFRVQLERILSLSAEQRAVIGNNAIKRINETYNLEVIYNQKFKVIQNILDKEKGNENFPYVRITGKGINNEAKSLFLGGLFSVVIPYYNMGKYIDETIDSVINSEFALKEIIIVNDGSTDLESISKLESYRDRPLFRVIDVPNQGLASARNLGAVCAQGEYLAFLDADDKVAPDYFAKAISILRQYKNVHFVGAWTQYFEGSSKIWPTFSPEPPLLLFHNLVNSSSLIYKRSSFLAAGLNDKNMPFQGLEDYESVISLVNKGFSGVVLPETLFYYRVRKNSMIRGVSKVKKTILYDYICKKHKDFYAAYSSETTSLLNSNGTGIVLDNPTLDLHLHSFPYSNILVREVILLLKKSSTLKKIALRAYNYIK